MCPSPGEAVLAQYRNVTLPHATGVQQPTRLPSRTTIASRPTSDIPIYRGSGGVPPLDEGLDLADIEITPAGFLPEGSMWDDLINMIRGEPLAGGERAGEIIPGAGGLVPVGTALTPLGAGVAGVAGAGLTALAAGGLSGLLDGVDAGANMGLFGVDWGDIFGLGQGDVAEVTGQKVVQSWNTGTAKFYRTQDGKIHTFTKQGVLKSWRPAKHIVVSKNPRMRTMIRANNRLDKLMKGVAQAVKKHLPKQKIYGQLPSSMLSKVEKAALKG